MTIETCSPDIHRLDYRCYIIPTIEPIDTITEDSCPIGLTKEVPEEHTEGCVESHMIKKKVCLSTDTVIPVAKEPCYVGGSINSDELDETNVRITTAFADANGKIEERPPSPKNEIYNYFIETELPGGVVIRPGGRTCDLPSGCVHAH